MSGFVSKSKIKRVIYKPIPKVQGICTIWDWDDRSQKYKKRNLGNRFYAYKKIDGRQKALSFETYEEAKRWRMSDSFIEIEAPIGLKFKEVREDYFRHKKNKLRVTTYESYLSISKHLEFFNSFAVREITARVIDEWLKFVKQPEYLKTQHKSRMTYRPELSVLRQILTYCSEYKDEAYQVPIKKRHYADSVIDEQRYQRARAENRFKYIPKDECDQFLGELFKQSEKNAKTAALYMLALFQMGTGCRIGEVAALRIEDFNFDRQEVAVYQTVQWARAKGRETQISDLTKTGDLRVVPLTKPLCDAIQRFIQLTGLTRGLVFSTNGLQPVGYRSIQYYYNRAFKRLGMKWTSTHILRHSFATDFLEKTGDRSALQGILGHKHQRQTDHYAKITDIAKARGMKQYEEASKASRLLLIPQAPQLGGLQKANLRERLV